MQAGILTKTVTDPADSRTSIAPTPTAFFTLPSGRKLAYDEYGSASGYPLFYFHDGGSSRLEAAFFESSAIA
jgi:hypothetical protein